MPVNRKFLRIFAISATLLRPISLLRPTNAKEQVNTYVIVIAMLLLPLSHLRWISVGWISICLVFWLIYCATLTIRVPLPL